MGCAQTWTCAPYYLPERPAYGETIAWGETNAVAFANSVLGARTNRFADFTDICAAIAGRAPRCGLYLDENRLAEIVIKVDKLPPDVLDHDACYHLLGHIVGRLAGDRVPAIDGLPPDVGDDRLRAIVSIAALTGSLKMMHVVGRTPEAADLDAATGGRQVAEVHSITLDDLTSAREILTGPGTGRLSAVCVGTPHLSLPEFKQLAERFAGRHVHPGTVCYVSAGRFVHEAAQRLGYVAEVERAGVTVITDTCTYYSGYLDDVEGTVVTNSAKWAFYAPPNIRVDVRLATLDECVDSAVRGEVVADDEFWRVIAA
jgi:predicted aconitase